MPQSSFQVGFNAGLAKRPESPAPLIVEGSAGRRPDCYCRIARLEYTTQASFLVFKLGSEGGFCPETHRLADRVKSVFTTN